MDDDRPAEGADGAEPQGGAAERPERELSETEREFLIRQSVVGELEEFFPPEFLDRVKARFEARLAERDAPPTD